MVALVEGAAPEVVEVTAAVAAPVVAVVVAAAAVAPVAAAEATAAAAVYSETPAADLHPDAHAGTAEAAGVAVLAAAVVAIWNMPGW